MNLPFFRRCGFACFLLQRERVLIWEASFGLGLGSALKLSSFSDALKLSSSSVALSQFPNYSSSSFNSGEYIVLARAFWLLLFWLFWLYKWAVNYYNYLYIIIGNKNIESICLFVCEKIIVVVYVVCVRLVWMCHTLSSTRSLSLNPFSLSD